MISTSIKTDRGRKQRVPIVKSGAESYFTAPDFGSKLTHAACLDRLALAALAHGDAHLAFRYIDRRCRIAPSPSAHHYILRAEALTQMAEKTSAMQSLSRALEIAPEDIQANRRMLDWGKGEPRIKAARVLCACDDNTSVLIEAVRVLKRAGHRAAGSIRVFDTYIRGWMAWKGAQNAELLVFGKGFEMHLQLHADPDHFLTKSGFVKCTAFHWPRDDRIVEGVSLRLGDEVILTQRVSQHGIPVRGGQKLPAEEGLRRARKEPLTVVVPAYRDFAATRACLNSLRGEMAAINCKVILVNDASPEAEMQPYLKRFAKRTGATLLTNEHNMGFVGAVNRALALVAEGDVILLNADTVLPGDAFRRLVKTARADPCIGTITPLSNNGEFTSFPRPAYANPMPSAKQLAAMSTAAARINKNLTVDIPSGIGFCLFISAACLKAAGHLSDSFQGGYLEDVDFCLRVRELGFRNVCDPSIFVAHAGSRSFLASKRMLVTRNLPIIEERFPLDETETQRFLELDPLAKPRAAIERVMLARASVDVLIVTGRGLARPIAEERARALIANGSDVWLACIVNNAIGFSNAAGSMPQSLTFRFDRAAEFEELKVFLSGLKLKRMEVAEPVYMPVFLAEMLKDICGPADLLLSDAHWMIQRDTDGHAGSRMLPNEIFGGPSGKIIVLCDEAQHFIKHCVPDEKRAIAVENLPKLETRKSNAKRPRTGDKQGDCGVLAFGRLSDDFKLIGELAIKTGRVRKSGSFIVLGDTIDDLALMAMDGVFVTASIPAGELPTLCQLYGLKTLFLASRRPVFGHALTREARETGLPLCYFDWSYGACVSSPRDLALPPDLDPALIASKLASWMDWPR